jgi:sterol desaturase/sphingolipid hydroxylase (fatty acid hydroxylase superfamily)
MLPLSFVLFTTLVGHSGYRSAYWLMIFHPFALPVALFSGKWLLNTGDHQMHHSRRRVNFGLFWNFWDKYSNTYMKCDIRAHNVDFWEKWAKNRENGENSAQAKKWLGRHNVSFAEVEWGF